MTEEEQLIAKQQKAEALQAALSQRVSDFKHSFQSGPGKRVYEYLSKFCFENASTFDASSSSTSDFNEGSRFVILEIRKWIDFDLTKGT